MSTENLHGNILSEGERLRQAIKQLDFPAIEAADKIGISRSLISSLITNKKTIQKYHLVLFELSLGINPDFIKKGTEPILLADKAENAAINLVTKSQATNSNGTDLYEKLLQAKDVIIGKQEAQIASLEKDKDRLNETVDRQRDEIDDLKREKTALGKAKTSA